MRMIRAIVISSVLFSLAYVALAEDRDGFKPIATSKELMEVIIIPASDALFNVIAEPPKTDAEWKALRNNALILAESGNLLMIGSRVKDQKAWMKYSREMLDTAVVTLKAVETKNVDAVIKAADEVVATCANCHAQFLEGAAPAQK